jgi:RHS repeat-associated protein
MKQHIKTKNKIIVKINFRNIMKKLANKLTTVQGRNQYIICLLFLLLGVSQLKAVNESYNGQILTGASLVTAGSDSTVATDARFGGITGLCNSYTDNKSEGFVILRITPHPVTKKYVSGTFTATLNLQVTSWTSPTTSQVQNITQVLTFNGGSGTTYNDMQVLKVPGAYKIKVVVTSASQSSLGLSWLDITNYIQLTSRVDVERYYAFDANYQLPQTSVTLTQTILPLDNNLPSKLTVSWGTICGAEEYDLEWVYIDDYDADALGYTAYMAATNLAVDFSRNTTRVTLKANTYDIPLVYEHGYLLFRVRGIGKAGTNYAYRIVGKWTDGFTTGVTSGPISGYHVNFKYYINFAHQQDIKNWQAISTYAEEGLRKDVVSYYDGTLRKRQIVTKSSTDDKSIVAETIYDHQGRPAINILPAPVNHNTIRYFNNFNQNSSGNPYSRTDFDTDISCASVIGMMKPDAQSGGLFVGASNYYSPYNPIANSLNETKLIPDAGGYPFSITEYMPDNTGRIKRQSGVGKNYKLDSAGHETKYFYGTPGQQELDRLFGSEVGFAPHYKKNAVQDANGQVSVSYIDADGKTIATALAGGTPSNLLTLYNAATLVNETRNDSLTLDILANSYVDSLNKCIISTQTHTVTAPGSSAFKFTYSVTPQSYSTQGYNALNLCYDCIYDLEITVLDNLNMCATPLYNSKVTLGALFSTGTTVSRTCEGFLATSVPAPFSLNLSLGTYTITKKLTVNEQSVNSYVEDYMSTFTPMRDTFIKRELAQIDTAACNIRCATCSSTNVGATASDIAAMGAFCQEICDTVVTNCTNARGMLLQDMTPPLGQYAKVDILDDSTAVSNDLLSIFNPNNRLPNVNAKWNYSALIYKDELGQPDTIVNSLGQRVRPNDPSITIKEFLDNYKPNWANEVINYHPESCLLQWCDTTSTSEAFDMNNLTTTTWVKGSGIPAGGTVNNFTILANAALNNYGSTFVTFGIVNNDPYFKNVSYGQIGKTAFLSKIQNYGSSNGVVYNIFQMAIITNSCPNAITTAQANTCLSGYTFGTNPTLDNQVWGTLVAFYNTEKKKRMGADRIAFTNKNGCNTDCIGTNPPQYPTGALHLTPCTDANGALYSTKDKRFPTANDVLSQITGGADVYNLDSIGMKNITTRLNSLQPKCYSCGFLQHWEGFLNGILARTTLVGTVNPLSINYLSRDLLANLGSPTANMSVALSTNVLTITLATGKTLTMTLPIGQTWTTGTTVSVNSIDTFATYSSLVLNVTLPNKNIYPITGVLNFSSTNPCVPVTKPFVTYYLDSLLIKNPAPSRPYSLYPWYVNGQKFSAQDIITLQQLADSLNVWDVGGSWTYNAINSTISGGQVTKQYSNLKLALTSYSTSNIGSGTPPTYSYLILASPGPAYKTYKSINTVGWTVNSTVYKWSSINATYLKDSMNFYDTGGNWQSLPTTSNWTQLQGGNIGKTYGLLSVQYDDTTFTSIPLYNTSLINSCATPSSSSPDSYANNRYKYSTILSYIKAGPTVATWTVGCNTFVSDTLRTITNLIDFMRAYDKKAFWTVNTSMDSLESGYQTNSYGSLVLKRALVADLSMTVGKTTGASLIILRRPGIDTMTYTTATLCSINQDTSLVVSADPESSCASQLINLATVNGILRYETYTDSLRKNIATQYIKKCLTSVESFKMRYNVSEYHYTLYYYDQANNLVKTVPPSGVVITTDTTVLNTINNNRLTGAGAPVYRLHGLETNYHYNSLNQVSDQKTPDAGISRFWYDRLGRLVASQNAKQNLLNDYSYTVFDGLGRINQVGELRTTSSLITTPTITKADATLTTWLGSGTKSQRTQTFYDTIRSAAITTLFGGTAQQNLRNRVVATTYTSTSAVAYEHATHYDYDILGNVKTLIQEYPEFDSKRIDYNYDQLSGKVNMVAYQAGKVDRLYHRYAYDADLRLRQVETSRDSVIWDRDAAYFYYRHRPMSRMELGQDQVQGIDYAYALQGWIKGVNSGSLVAANDGGKDGIAATSRENIARDAFGYMLRYHTNDYKAIGTGVAIEPAYIGTGFEQSQYQLFNGNIQAMTVGIGQTGFALQGYNFYYDQLNRLRSAATNTGITSATNAFSATASATNMSIDYDPNGNIKGLNRKSTSTSTVVMDNLQYFYTANTNKLDFVTDPVTAASFTGDIDNQTAGNYLYDAIGNLRYDRSEGIDTIAWNVYGKMTRIKKNATSWLETFGYDASGNRVKKDVNGNKTYYIRDAQGNIMATYKINSGSTDKILESQYLYGSSRLGEYSLNLNLTTATISTITFTRIRGQRRYELANHLGNVQVVVSDRKVQKDDNADGLIDYYVADIVSATDYYAFGAVMSDRSFNGAGYRFGFNGKENDNEVSGTGNSINFGARIYDSRLGRFKSIDSYFKKYPFFSPYQFAGNSPIRILDNNGDSLKLTGGTIETDKFKAVLNKAFEGSVKVEVNTKGYVTLAGDYEKLSENDKNLYDALNTVIIDAKTTDLYLLNEKERALAAFGGWQGGDDGNGKKGNTIDMYDVEKMSDTGFSPEGDIIHEIWETFLDQAKGINNYEDAHQDALNIQGSVDGVRVLNNFGDKDYIETGTGKSYTLYQTKEGKYFTKVFTIEKNDVTGDSILPGWIVSDNKGGTRDVTPKPKDEPKVAPTSKQ